MSGIMTQPVFLLGPPLGGKSTVGKALAEKQSLPFIDMDKQIEKEQGRTIPEIFAAQGEAGFRLLETQLLLKLEGQGGAIISTGGGVVEKPENRDFLKSQNTVYLHNELEDLLLRGRKLKAKGYDMGRPLLVGEDWETRLAALFAKRHPLYTETAKFQVDCAGSVDSIVEDLTQKLRVDAGLLDV